MAPTREDSTMSSDSGLKDSDLGGPDPELSPSLLDNSGLSRIFIDAVQYSEVISEEDGEKQGERGEGGEKPKEPREVDVAAMHRLADLIGRDLSTPELVASERFAKFSVMKGGGLDVPSDESEEDEFDKSETAVHEDSQPPSVSSEPEFAEKRPMLERTTSISSLTPDEIVKLLIDEFGPLTVDENDSEQLVWEMDGAYLQEVAILGIIHLTTHRITFHASLLSTRPDLLPERQIIRTGPVTIHRRGWLRKRRVWLELSHDMLTIFPSSKVEDRIRPIRSCLLSAVKRIHPEDENSPRIVKIEFDSAHGGRIRYAEFDTEESAREWRRELQGALFMFRHSRASCLDCEPENETRGVQISIPLSRINSFTTRLAHNYASMLKIELSSGKVRSSLSDTDDDLDSGENDDSLPSSDDEETDLEGRTIELGVAHTAYSWGDFGGRVAHAKMRERLAGTKESPKVIVDFGALSFAERQYSGANEVADSTEKAIRNALALSEGDEIWYTRARITRSITSSGYFVICKRYVGFWTKCLSIKDAKYRFPISTVAGARPNYRYLPKTFGIVLDLREHPSMYFDLTSEEQRDEIIRRVDQVVETYRVRRTSHAPLSPSLSPRKGTFLESVSPAQSNGYVLSDSPLSMMTPSRTSSPLAGSGKGTSSSPPSSPSFTPTPLPTVSHVLSPLGRTIDRATSRCLPTAFPNMPKVINLPSDTLPRTRSRHFVCLTIGSRGDVQPYIALGQTLLREGHRVTIVTHAEYKEWVEDWGIIHRTAGGDPGALMKLSVEHKMFSPQFFKESLSNFRTWLDDLLVDAWEMCKDADVLLESPSAMAGVHIAEALNIPYFRTFTMPWTRTTEFPHPFLSPPVELARFNISTYVLFDNLLWSATAGQINRWRRNTLQIGNTDMGRLVESKIPFIYNFSPSVVPKPMDWGDAITLSGYWFLDNPELDWAPPDSLVAWMAKARYDGKPIVYIGFGSITVPNPPAMTRSIVKAVKKSGVRAIISKGWSERMSKSDEPEFEFPPECYAIDKVPHDWLFPLVDAALHHGGAGTTGASLRAGIPTLIKPWFGDQFFWASRVQKIGAGMKVSSLHSSELASALVKATTDRIMKERAASVGENIRRENGTQNALRAIYVYLDRAGRDRKSLD